MNGLSIKTLCRLLVGALLLLGVRTVAAQEREQSARPNRKSMSMFEVENNSVDRSVRPRRRDRGRVSGRGAVLTLREQVCDFGRIPRRGGDLVHEVIFTNTGDAPLVVTRIITSNTCLKVSCSHKPIDPGASGVIKIVYQPQKSDAGSFSRVVQVCSNSINGVAHITVRGHSFDQIPAGRRPRNDKLKIKVKKIDPEAARSAGEETIVIKKKR